MYSFLMCALDRVPALAKTKPQLAKVEPSTMPASPRAST